MKMLMALTVDGEGAGQAKLPAMKGMRCTLRAQTQLLVRVVEPAYDDQFMGQCDGVGVSSVRIGDVELLVGGGFVSVRQAMLVVVGRVVVPATHVVLELENTTPLQRWCPFLAWFVEPLS